MKNILTCSLIVLGIMGSSPANAIGDTKNIETSLNPQYQEKFNKFIDCPDITEDFEKKESADIAALNTLHKNNIRNGLAKVSSFEGCVADAFIDGFMRFYDTRHCNDEECLPARQFIQSHALGYYLNIHAIQREMNEIFSQEGIRREEQGLNIVSPAVPDNNYKTHSSDVIAKIAYYNDLMKDLTDYIFADSDYSKIQKSEFKFEKLGCDTLNDAVSMLENVDIGRNRSDCTALRKFLNDSRFFFIAAGDYLDTCPLRDELSILENTISFNPSTFQIYLDVSTVRTLCFIYDLDENIVRDFVLSYYQYKYEEFISRDIVDFIKKNEMAGYFPYVPYTFLTEDIGFENIGKYRIDGEQTKSISKVFEKLSNNFKNIDNGKKFEEIFNRSMRIVLHLDTNASLSKIQETGTSMHNCAIGINLLEKNRADLQKQLNQALNAENANEDKTNQIIKQIDETETKIQRNMQQLKDTSFLQLMGITENLNNTSEYARNFKTILYDVSKKIVNVNSLHDSRLIKYLFGTFNALMDKYEQATSSDKDKIRSQITNISGLIFQGFSQCTAAQASCISDSVAILLSLTDFTQNNLTCKDIMNIALSEIINYVFNALFVYASVGGDIIDSEDTMCKAYVRKILDGKFGISRYTSSLNVLKNQRALFNYLTQSASSSQQSVSKRAYSNLPSTLKSSAAFENNETFDTQIIPQLMSNALDLQYVTEELASKISHVNWLILLFVKEINGVNIKDIQWDLIDNDKKRQILFHILRYGVNIKDIQWDLIDNDKKRQILFHILRYCGYLKKK
jgi:hypothetical protein